MTTLAQISVCLAVCVGGSGLALAAPRRLQGHVLVGCGCVAATFVAAAALGVLLDDGARSTGTLWSIPGVAALTVTIDSLSAVFLLATGLVLFPASI
jgi:formate hydrogenlyase subunit 3/multisubunit Na+/H+ antiporter MnhD subunit